MIQSQSLIHRTRSSRLLMFCGSFGCPGPSRSTSGQVLQRHSPASDVGIFQILETRACVQAEILEMKGAFDLLDAEGSWQNPTPDSLTVLGFRGKGPS